LSWNFNPTINELENVFFNIFQKMIHSWKISYIPPHLECPKTTIDSTWCFLTANSSPAAVEWNLFKFSFKFSKEGTMLATFLITNRSPGLASKISAGSTRESQQDITHIFGTVLMLSFLLIFCNWKFLNPANTSC